MGYVLTEGFTFLMHHGEQTIRVLQVEKVASKIGYEEPAQLIEKRNGPRMESKESYPYRFLKDDGKGHVEKDVGRILKSHNISISFKMVLKVNGAVEWLQSRHLESEWDRFIQDFSREEKSEMEIPLTLGRLLELHLLQPFFKILKLLLKIHFSQ